jgi:NADP-dependent alcohol dehydrogenase
MYNFSFRNPTNLIFGKGQIATLANLISKDKNLMLTFGGGSVKQNGIYKQVIAALKEHTFIEFWGIEPNPTIETLRKAINIGKEKKIDYILAVGGGSVLDGTKLIAAGICYDGDAWDIVLKGYANKTIPFSSVMTLPATGSEMNSGAVISRAETQEKYAFGNDYPVFSILDPEATYSLPPFQIACGLADIFVHIIEQYMTSPNQSRVMDRWAEGLLLTIIEIAPLIKKDQKNYDVMADFMLSATLALNDMIRMGVTQDWVTHMLGHEITALHGITHGATLAIVLNGTLRTLKNQKFKKLLQYADRVWNIKNDSDDEKVNKAIEKTEEFFRSLGLHTRLSEENIGDETINAIAEKFNKAGYEFGEKRNVTGDVAKQILLNCK